MTDKIKELEAFHQLAQVITVSLDTAGRIRYINPYGARLLGYTEQDLINIDWFEKCLPADIRASMRSLYDKFLQEDTSSLEFHQNQVLTRDNRKRMISWRNVPHRNASGAIIGSYGTGIDISELEEANQREKAMGEMLENALNEIYIVDAESFAVLHLNRAARDNTGINEADKANLSLPDLVTEAARELFTQQARDITADQEASGRFETRFNRPRDGDYPADVHIHGGRYLGRPALIVYAQDISIRKQSEAALKEREQELLTLREQLYHSQRLNQLNALANGIAHEINQPLSAIRTFAETGQKYVEASRESAEEAVEALQKIGQQAQRAGEIIQALRDMMKKHSSKREAIELNDLITQTIELIKPELKQEDIAVTLDLAPAELLVDIDRVQIQQVLLNLLQNSVDSLAKIPSGRRIDIVTRMEAQSQGGPATHIKCLVRDNGVGISLGEVGKIFLPFNGTKQNGLGLGLSICRDIISRHGGELEVNTEVAPGCEFYFTLPLSKDL